MVQQNQKTEFFLAKREIKKTLINNFLAIKVCTEYR